MKTCNSCGAENPNKNLFCATCGAPFASESEGKAEPISGTPDAEVIVKPVESSDNGSYTYDQSTYTQPKAEDGDYSIIALLSLILGIVGFFINPLYLMSLAGFILGIIGVANSVNYKSLATAGLIVSIVSFVVQVILDIFCTFGLGIFC